MKKGFIAGSLVSFAIVAAMPKAQAESWFQYEAGVGATMYQTEDGRWYQQGMAQSEVHSTNVAFSLGVTGPLVTRGKWGVDWHVDYENLGRAAASCWCTPNDENYNPHSHTYNPNVLPAPLAYFTGNGRSYGFALTLEPYYWVKGVRVGVEAGAYINHESWDEDVSHWASNWNMPLEHNTISLDKWAVAPVVGVNVGNGKWTVSYRHYFLSRENKGEQFPPVWNDANVIELKYKF